MTPGEAIAVHGEQLSQLRTDLEKHEERDDGVHGRMLGELGAVKTELATLNANFAALRETFAPMVQAYFDEHPSKVQHMPALVKPPSVPPPYKIEAKRLGMVIGGILVFLEGWSHVRAAIAGWLAQH